MRLVPLSRELAEMHAARLVDLARLIPGSYYTAFYNASDLLDEGDRNGKRQGTKWSYSWLLLDPEPIGLAVGYERGPDPDNLLYYPDDTVYLDVLAVRQRRQGYGGWLLRAFLESAGDRTVSLTTGADPSNQPVRDFYRRHGFRQYGPIRHLRDGPHISMRRQRAR